MTLTNFRASDFKDGSTVKSVASKRDRSDARRSEPVPTSKPVEVPGADPNAVPAGTVPEVLTWVGDDAERAQKALDVELENDKPRKGLLDELSAMVDAEADDDSDDDSDDSTADESDSDQSS